MDINEQRNIKLMHDLEELLAKHYSKPSIELNSNKNEDNTWTCVLEAKGIGLNFKATDKDINFATSLILESAIYELKRKTESEMYGTLKQDEVDKETTGKIEELLNLPVVLISFISEYRSKSFDDDPRIIVGKNKEGKWECTIESEEAFIKVRCLSETKEQAIEGACRRALGILYPSEVNVETVPTEVQA